jgi:hypothetical protein
MQAKKQSDLFFPILSKIFNSNTNATNSILQGRTTGSSSLVQCEPIQRITLFGKDLPICILARVWHRIISNSTKADLQDQQFIELHAIVEKLNTIRNIYILLTTGLVKKLATRINDIYKESVTFEDTIQIGSFGIARAGCLSISPIVWYSFLNLCSQLGVQRDPD